MTLRFSTALYLACLFSANLIFGQIQINELQASNINAVLQPNGKGFSDWIELYNSSSEKVDLTGWTLTDQLSNPTKWTFPTGTTIEGNSYLVIWANKTKYGLNTNFKLSTKGEAVGLFNAKKKEQDRIEFGPIPVNTSYGLISEDSKEWKFFYEPTPGASNSTAQPVDQIEIPTSPSMDKEAGFYPSGTEVMLSCTEPDLTIRYTTDGSDPNSSSPSFNAPIKISKNTVVKARSFPKSGAPSIVVTNTYLVEKKPSLPVVCLSLSPEYLWDEQVGVYTVGKNGVSSFNTTANYNRKWTRPAHLEYFEKGEQELSQQLDLAVGGLRRNQLQKSFKLTADEKYGEEMISYPFFKDKNLSAFKALTLRNSGYPDFQFTHMRDLMMQSLVIGKMEVDYQSGQPTIVFLNGEYWGVYNMRERLNEDYIYNNHGVSRKSLHMGEVAYKHLTLRGSLDEFMALREYIHSTNIQSDEAYDYIDSQMDISEFIDYYIAQIYFGNWDWPGNNIKFWKEKGAEGRWRWILFDVDFGFGYQKKPDFNTLAASTASKDNQWFNGQFATQFFRDILKQPRIRREFVQRMAAHLNSTFTPQRVIGMINQHANNIESELPRHIDRWDDCDKADSLSSDGCVFDNMTDWKNNVEKLRYWARERPSQVVKHVQQQFGIPTTFLLTVAPTKGGRVTVNGVELDPDASKGKYFVNVPTRFKAIARPGYRFTHWGEDLNATNPEFIARPTANYTITPHFTKSEEIMLPKVIEKNTKLKKGTGPYVSTGTVTINKGAKLTIGEGVTIKLAERSDLRVKGQLDIEGTQEAPVTFTSNKAAGMETWGSIIIESSPDTNYLSHLIIEHGSRGRNSDKEIAALCTFNSSLVMDHIVIENVESNPIFGRSSHVIMTNSRLHAKVTGDLINIKKGFVGINNCEVIGNNKVDTDGIDYDGIVGGYIKNTSVHGFFGGNSDAVDLGEQSTDILMENNLIYDCTDKGISIGQASTGILKNNIIVNCNMGIGIKDSGAYASVVNHTFYGNAYAIACFQKNDGRGAGTADVTKSVFAYSSLKDNFTDQYGEITSSDNLTNTAADKGVELTTLKIKDVFSENYNMGLQDRGSQIDKAFGGQVTKLKLSKVAPNNTAVAGSKKADWFVIKNQNNTTVNLAGSAIAHGNEKFTLPLDRPDLTRIQPNSSLKILTGSDCGIKKVCVPFELKDTSGSISILPPGQTIAIEWEYTSAQPDEVIKP